jgi:transposase-like protein
MNDDGNETVTACPDCNSSQVYERTTMPAVIRWRCHHCAAQFAEPKRRPSRRGKLLDGVSTTGGVQ